MRFVSIPITKKNLSYWLSGISGALLKTNEQFAPKTKSLPHKVETALNFCHKPYLLKQPSTGGLSKYHTIHNNHLGRLANNFVLFSRFNFYIAMRYASFGESKLPDSVAAVDSFHKLTSHLDRSLLCLPRALFMGRVSAKFASSGVIFIGVFLPSRSMHAWVIEDGVQPDFRDGIWINYQPVAAIY